MSYQNKESWEQFRACADAPAEIFFPSDGAYGPAKALCRACVVREECLEYALEHRIDDGMWGGASERERRRILKARAKNDGQSDAAA